ncbi:MAG: sigma factor-like helix-turn-helix DNA-binding protein, partial [Microthrixaceae bacterium]
RRVVELVDVDGLTYQEAADVLDVPLGTVMSRLHRARRRIRDLLVPAGFGPGAVDDVTEVIS